MKKLFFLGALFAVGLGFTACSSDKDEVAVSGPNENGGGQYIAIGINLPNVPPATTRATDNGENIIDLNDGMSKEYAVKDASLLIFNSGGTFKEAWTINTKPWNSSDDPQVTQVSTKVVQQVTGDVAVGDQMLVILNANGLISVDDDAHTLQVMKGTTLTSFTGTITNLYTQADGWFASTNGLDCGAMDDNGFYMANAVLTDQTTAATETQMNAASERLLVPISAVYDSKEAATAAATAGNADQIYVERGMAKVTMEGDITTPTLSASKIDGTIALTGEVTGWTIDNCNPNSFLVRQPGLTEFKSLKSNSTVSGAAVYRYFGTTAITEGSPATFKYRTYFAKSANYDKSGIDASTPTFSLNRVTSSTTFSTAFGDENPQYCFENTFSVDDQDVNKTTLVQVAIQAKATTAEDLFTLRSNKSTIYTETSLETVIRNEVLDYLKEKNAFNTTAPGSFSATDITIEFSDETTPTAGEITIAKLTPSSAVKGIIKTDFLTDNDFNSTATDNTTTTDIDESIYNVLAAANVAVGKIERYLNGVSYYNIRIKHYGDVLTPWKNNETPQPSIGTIYPAGDNRNNNYLGRYGVLRNNWYNLKVKSIRSLGEATPRTINWPGTPDDELDSYITFQINVLSWAKHVTQNAEL